MKGPSQDEAVRKPDGFWNLYSKVYDCIYHLMPYRQLLWDTYQALELEPGMKVLDAGCGTGNFEFFLSEKNPPRVEIEALDFSDGMLSLARSKCAGLDNVSFVHGDLNVRLPYPDASFDRILSINVLYTLADRDETVAELMRVLKPGGIMVLTSPVHDVRWPPLMKDHFGRVRNIWGLHRKVFKVLGSLRVLCTQAVGSFVLNVLVINRREEKGEYHHLNHEELHEFLHGHRKNGLEDFSIRPAFGMQNLFATAVKATT